VLGAASEPLDVGRATRLIPPAIRRALIARDRGCAFPGCRRPPRWCDAHHIHTTSAPHPNAAQLGAAGSCSERFGQKD